MDDKITLSVYDYGEMMMLKGRYEALCGYFNKTYVALDESLIRAIMDIPSSMSRSSEDEDYARENTGIAF